MVTVLACGLSTGAVAHATPPATGPAHLAVLALPATSESAPVDAIVALQAEVLVLVALDAFPTVPPALAQVYDTYRSYTDGLDRPSLRSWLHDADLDGANALDRLRAQGFVLHDPTISALQPLPDGAWTALANGNHIGLAPSVYVAALDELDTLSFQQSATPATGPPSATPDTTPAPLDPVSTTAPVPPSPPTGATVPVTTLSPPSTAPLADGAGSGSSSGVILPAGAGTAAGATTGSSPVGATSPTSTTAHRPATTLTTRGRPPTTQPTPLSSAAAPAGATGNDTTSRDGASVDSADAGTSPLLLGGAALAALVALLVALALRRRRTPRTSELDVDAVLEAGRRLASVSEPAALFPVVLQQIREVLEADHAGYHRRDLDRVDGIDGRDSIDTLDRDLAASVLAAPAQAALDRVADTALSWRGTLAWSAGTSPVAVVATAVTAEGRVRGVLVARRRAEQPFQAADQSRLERLAPLVAAAQATAARHHALTELTFTDALTKLANRRQLDDHVRAAAGDTTATGTVGFAMIDVDHFKSYNDTHGHPAGDELLRRLADVLTANVRPGDVVYRYGGEEFAILLPGADQATAAEVGERVRRAVHDAELPGGSSQPNGRVTVSIGVAVGAAAQLDQLKSHADESLYAAKKGGRDRTVVAVADTPQAEYRTGSDI